VAQEACTVVEAEALVKQEQATAVMVVKH